MILSLLIYGSRARGDHRVKSDVDLLAIIDDGPLRSESFKGGASLYHYPFDLLMRRARDGDLFALHLTMEAKVLHDTANIFKIVKREFNKRNEYTEELVNAYCIIQFFLTRRKLLTKREARKRLIWAVRTILTARSAEANRPVFSSSALAAFAGMTEVKPVIDNRNQSDVEKMLSVARRVCQKYAEVRVDFEWPAKPADQRDVMESRGGIVADTLRFVQPKTLVFKLRKKAPHADEVVKSEYFFEELGREGAAKGKNIAWR